METKISAFSRLQFSNFKLNTLLEITRSINENLSTDKLLKMYENLLSNELNIGKVILYSYNKTWKRVLMSGVDTFADNSIDIINDLLPITDISTTTTATNEFIKTFDIIIPVFHNNLALAYVFIGDIDEEQEGVSPTIKHLRFIQTMTNIIVVAIENKRLFSENIRQEAMRKELELATKVQSMLIPDPSIFPRNEKIHVEAFYQPHFEVGGDYYDIFELSDKEFGFCIADVSGKGISAAMLMSNFQAYLHALFTPEISLTDLVKKLNYRVLTSTHGERFITLFIAKYNYETRQLHFVNAGHNPPILYNKQSGELTYLRNGCPGIGMLDEIPFINVGIFQIPAQSTGCKLLCYTDGLIEFKSYDTIESGLHKIEEFTSNDDSIVKTISTILEKLNIMKENQKFFDDISILGIDFF